MSTNHVCPRCGRPWPDRTAGSLSGCCPLCLLEFAFADPAADELVEESADRPTRLGPYEILSELGRGGMGVVYKALHSGLDRTVALKVLHAACARQAGFPTRFQREGQVLAALAHPHIVGVHDLGCEAGFYYLAMEYVDGPTLRHLLEPGPLAPAVALAILCSLCDALQCAHEAGVVHRDVKPENILIKTEHTAFSASSLLSASNFPKLTDFGIAKLIHPGTAVPQPLTETTAVLGTRCYMAPEQLERGREVDHRADIYALAAVGYEMLTGELPLGVFAPPSRRANVSPRVDNVLLQALAKDPAHRPASAREFKAALQQASGQLATPARSRSRGRGRLAAVTGLVLLLVGGLFALLGRQSREPAPSAPGLKPEPGVRVLLGHTAPVWCVAFNPDGTRLASASEDRTVRLWDPATAEAVATLPILPGTEVGPVSVAFAPGGQCLAAAGRESAGTVRLWNLHSGQATLVLTGHSREVNAVAVAPNGSLLASASQDQSVRLWELPGGKFRYALREYPARDQRNEPVLCVAFSRDSTRLAVGMMHGGVRLWDPQTGSVLPVSIGHVKRVWSVAFAPDGRMLASGSHDRTIRLWNLTAQPITSRVLADGPEVRTVAFAPDGKTLASGSQDGVIRLWDVATGRQLGRLDGHTDKVVSVSFAPDGRTLASASWDRTVRLWNLFHP